MSCHAMMTSEKSFNGLIVQSQISEWWTVSRQRRLQCFSGCRNTPDAQTTGR